MSSRKKQSFLQGAAILAAAAIIIKILGAIYKIPLGNILGDSGYALFYTAYTIFNVFIALSTAGLPVALSKMVSEANTLGRHDQVKRIFRVALTTFLWLGILCFAVMFFFAKPLAQAMKNEDAYYSIIALAPSVFLACMMSAYRGYIQGLSNMTPTAVSQVLEVMFKVLIGLGLSIWLKRSGYPVTIQAAGAILGTTAGSLASLLFLIAAKRRQSRYICEKSASEPPADPNGVIFKKLVSTGIPILLGALVLNFSQFIDDFQIMNRLQSVAGFTYGEAKVLFGAYSKVLTIMNLPPAFVIPFSLSIIPAVTASLTLKDRRGAARLSVSSLRIVASLAMPAAVGLAVLAVPIIDTLYTDIDSCSYTILMLLGAASFFICLSTLTSSILQAYGKISIPVYSMLAGGAVKILINFIIVAKPSVNIMGAPIGTIACYLIITCINLRFIVKLMPSAPSFFNIFVKPAFASAVMGAGVYACYGLFGGSIGGLLSGGRLAGMVSILLAIAVGLVIYAVLVVALRIITKEDMSLIPKGEKLAKMLRLR